MRDGRWVEVSPSQFDHERHGLELVKQALPDAAPYRAWANFEFRDNRGRWHEVDLLVLARDTLYLVELKHYRGTLRGNDHVWSFNGSRSMDSPLLLTRRKAQYFSSLLKDRLREKVGSTPIPRGAIPYVQELVFLHHSDFRSELPPSSAINIYGLDGRSNTSRLPGISERLLAPATRSPVTEEQSLLIADLMKAIGLAPRRQREVGSWIIDEEPLGDGDGWQDWPAYHHADQTRSARIRFYLPTRGATSAEEHERARAVTQEYQLLSRLKYGGLQVPEDLVKDPELGIGLVFPQRKTDVPLDLWLADHRGQQPLEIQLDIIGALADIVQYAHRNRVVHRTLNPRACAIRERNGGPVPQIVDWDSAGVLPANSSTGSTTLSAGPLGLMSAAPNDSARLFAAPEGQRPADPAQLDVFGLGSLAFYILTDGQLPATERGELMDRLRREQGLDLAADMPQVPSPLRQLVLDATNPSPAKRIGNAAEFVDRLTDARRDLLGADEGTDPLEAGPGAALADGRFTYVRRLGAGSTAVGILVRDGMVGGAERVLKVAKDSDAEDRLRAEASILGKLDNEDRIVTLHGVEQVGGRLSLILRYAGRTTLAEELSARGGRLSLDVLERWGSDLLHAVIALERVGVTHRDIKPSNLGVFQSSKRADTHLLMFDFSMAGVDTKNVDAGTPPYLDPFLGTGGRHQYDTAAERYGAAAVLFEMATGQTPTYGPDPAANPAAINDDLTVDASMFEDAVAPSLVTFFSSALSRDVAARPDTAEDMLASWRQIYTQLDERPVASQDDRAEKAEASTPLQSAGLSVRAVSALAAMQVTTVGELLATDSTLLNRLLAKEAKDTRAEVKNRFRDWTSRLGKQTRSPGVRGLLGLEDAVQSLLAAVSGGRTTTRSTAARLLLGTDPGLDEFANTMELASKLGKAPQRGQQLIKELQADWAQNDETRNLLDDIMDVAKQVLADSGDVVAISTLTAEIRSRLPDNDIRTDATVRSTRERYAAGLLRVAFDRLSEHESVSGHKELVRRRHGGRLALVATDERLVAAAEAAARRADELVAPASTAGTLDTAVISSATAARELRAAFQRGFQTVSDSSEPPTPPADSRLVRLAAALSKRARVSGRGELHSVGLSPSQALTLALAGLAQSEALEPSQIRDRVAARFPAIDRLPGRPQLDSILESTNLGLHFVDGRYRFPDAGPPSSTTVHSKGTTALPPTTTPEAAAVATPVRTDMLHRSISERGFLAVAVPVPRIQPGLHSRVADHLADQYQGDIVDVTGILIDAMRSFAAERGIGWAKIQTADAPNPRPQDAKGLSAVVAQVMPKVDATINALAFEGDPTDNPLILTELSPLARYDHMELLARLSDLGAARVRPVWLVLPQVRGQKDASVDGRPMQLGSPGGQVFVWDQIVPLPRTVVEEELVDGI